jgi:small-conductance mechanosensitive channel
MTLFGYILTPLKSIFASVIGYIPNLFTIIIIYYLIKFLIRGVKFLASEIEGERLKIPGFYPDWAMPTFNIVRFLLIAFMIAMIYPYLPGSSSGVFQGVSVFVGLIVSLGSGSAIGNIIAGLVITYMRPFRIGDRIKLGEVIGDVIEKTPFVTRLKTPRNEIITMPNSSILSSQVTNLTLSASDYGLIVHANVAVGYEVPWQVAHELLIKAAKATENTIKEREPFVFDLGLEDYYNTYQINVYIDDANKMLKVITDLNSNIQNMFLAEGIDLESPILISERGQSPKYKKKEEK